VIAPASHVPLQLSGIEHRYGSLQALTSVDLRIGVGVTGILGVNGAGKSTLLSIAAGTCVPSEGSVSVAGSDPYDHATRRRAVSRIALVPQEFEFPRRFSLRDFLRYMAWMRDVPRAGREEAVVRASALVGLDDRLRSRMGELSGGMLRRAAIAQALLADPAVVLLDESTAGLDPHQRAEVRDLIEQIGQTRSVVLASHIVEDVGYLADRILVLDAGRVVFDGDAGTIAGRVAPGEGVHGSALERGFLDLVGHGGRA
jgi:ABC-2 type transport system ATP-binding protein